MKNTFAWRDAMVESLGHIYKAQISYLPIIHTTPPPFAVPLDYFVNLYDQK